MYEAVAVDDGERALGHERAFREDSPGESHPHQRLTQSVPEPSDTHGPTTHVRETRIGFFNWAAPIFGRFADRWSPDDIETIADWLRPSVSAGGTLLDVGGGTGALARKLATALDAHVTVLDPTAEMLRYVPGDGPAQAVQGTAEAMPFPESSFDALIVTDAFHHFRDQPGAVLEFARVVRPGGLVAVVELDPRGFVMRSIVLGEKLLGEPGAFFEPNQLCDFMAQHGIAGRCERLKGVSYRYSGVVNG